MSGHSKWSKIKRLKGATDARRGKLFSRLSREISIAAKLGGGEPNFNPRLRTAISTARSESVPVENIQRAIKKGTGELAGGDYEEIVYEGYGPSGVAMIIETATNNKNRTAAEMRLIFSKNHGNLGSLGSVAWMFEKKGVFLIPSQDTSEEALMDFVIDAGGDDIKSSEDSFEVFCPLEKFDLVGEALKKAKITPSSSQLMFIPKTFIEIKDTETAKQSLLLFKSLDDYEDTQSVYTNFDIPEEILSSIEI